MDTIYQIKTTIKSSKPPIWRRFVVPHSISLHSLHKVLQVLFRWEDYHLHEFTIEGEAYGIPDPEEDPFWEKEVIDERKTVLSKVAKKERRHFDYWYDFGDNWHHDIVIEKIMQNQTSMKHPRCIGGKRASPPEDVGGVWGYKYFLDAINDPNHEEHDEKLEWIGGEFDPEAFDIDEINEELEHIKLKTKEK